MTAFLLTIFSIITISIQPINCILQRPSQQELPTKPISFVETSTNIQYTFVSNHRDYRLYKLIPKAGINQAQVNFINRNLEQYLRESFDAPQRHYFNVLQQCGTTILAFFSNNSTLGLNKISALLLAHREAYDNSEYVCFLSTLEEHRQKGLGTKLLNEFIKNSIRSNLSRVTLHVNTENASALTLYLKCGMRCIQHIAGYYYGDQTFASQDAFFMSLQLKNVKNSSATCQSTSAVNIPHNEETSYKQSCPQASSG
ncbi:unnamed protein product [Adineta ricciae]|uniref:N-acetyltransferase domain-containing protein n=1 Tax=Adineta ricciae TaxID=249248 RepID=A0A814A2D5_ADIRI|nr:unnamed protein product [Adineta ricciae]CAF0908405.1 unnamed protein product [Adineta ricciae]